MKRAALSSAPPSPHFERHLAALRDAARLGPVLDLACGRGRHAVAVASTGLETIAIDRNQGFLQELSRWAARDGRPLWPVRFDLEGGLGIPLLPGRCGAVLVFRYLHRPLADEIEKCLAPGGLLLYETFTTLQLAFGTGPRNPDFLLQPGELPTLFPGLDVIAFDEDARDGEATARLAARRPV